MKVWITLLVNGGYRIYKDGKCVGGNNTDSVGLAERIMELIIDTKCKWIVFS